jgi:transcriptional regulator with XRE-family HTH domain
MNLRVKEICKAKNITIGELADKMNMARESLSRAINGNPTLDTLEKIAAALNVNVSELFQSGSELYGLVTYKEKTYKIESIESIKSLLNDVKLKSNI